MSKFRKREYRHGLPEYMPGTETTKLLSNSEPLTRISDEKSTGAICRNLNDADYYLWRELSKRYGTEPFPRGYIDAGRLNRLLKHQILSLLAKDDPPSRGTQLSCKRYAPEAPEAVDLAAAPRVNTTVNRIVRDTELTGRLKELHQHRCQICGLRIELGEGREYSEAHHLQPLGKPHDGPDVAGNIVVLCPNHHAMLDFLAHELVPDKLKLVEGHDVDPQYLDYHNKQVRLRRLRSAR